MKKIYLLIGLFFLMNCFAVYSQVEYSYTVNDPENAKNFEFSVGGGADINLSAYWGLEVNYLLKKVTFNTQYAHSLFTFDDKPNSRHLNKFVLTAGFNFADNVHEGRQKITLSKTGNLIKYTILKDVNVRSIWGVQGGFHFSNSVKELNHDSIGTVTNHFIGTSSFVIGFYNKNIRSMEVEIPEFNKTFKRTAIITTYINLMLAPSIKIDENYEGRVYNVTDLTKQTAGCVLGFHVLSARPFGFFYRIEVGLLPGAYAPNDNNKYYYGGQIGMNIGANIMK